MLEITFENLPSAVSQIHSKLDNLERLLAQINILQQPEPDRWFDITELSGYLPDKPSIPTIYGRVHSNTIPFHKSPGQKKLRFLKSEIDDWLKSGRKKTLAETASEANSYIKRKGLKYGI